MSRTEPRRASLAVFCWIPLALLGPDACKPKESSEITSSSSSNWLTCKTDADCVAVLGLGTCSPERICVDERNQPLSRPKLDSSAEAIPADTAAPSGDTLDATAAPQSPSTAPSNAALIPLGDASHASSPNSASLAIDAARPDSGAQDDASSSASDTELCVATCAKTAGYSLPQALCEDWNLSLSFPVYEYCITASSFSPDPNLSDAERCRVYCETSLAQVTTASCRAVLPEAMQCVADSGFYAEPIEPIETCLFAGCTAPLLQMSSECSGMRAAWLTAHTMWQAAALTQYSFTYLGRHIRVQDGTAEVVVGDPLDTPPTIDDLFAQIQATLDTNDAFVNFGYDPVVGFPTRLVTYSVTPFDSLNAGCAAKTETAVTEFSPE